MTKANEKKITLTGVKVTPDTMADMRLVESQGLCDTSELLKQAARLYMALLPESKLDRIPLSAVTDQAIADIKRARQSNAQDAQDEA